MNTATYDVELAVKTIGQLCKEYGISLENLRTAFPTRPATQEDLVAITGWLAEQANAKVRGTEQATSINPPRPSAPQSKGHVTADMLPEGNYALPGKDGGKTHFYRVSHREGRGKWAGTTFVNIKERASDELYDLRSKAQEGAVKWAIVEYGYEAAGLLFAERLDRCRKCYKGLTDEDNPYKPYGYGPDCGPNVMG